MLVPTEKDRLSFRHNGGSSATLHPIGRKRELALARSRRRLNRSLAQLLGVAPPFIGELEEQGAAIGIIGLFGGASAFVRVLLV